MPGRYEYKLLPLGETGIERVHNLLTQLNADGWQLDTVLEGDDGTPSTLRLKRESEALTLRYPPSDPPAELQHGRS